jgi:hypothetical protein
VIWLAWRQFRLQAFVAAGFLIAVAIAFALTGPHLVHLYDTTVATCGAHNDCGPVQTNFLKKDDILRRLGLFLVVLPALIGMFWGAPLVARELENGSFRLAWTQSVTRNRWIVTKFCLIGIISMMTAGILSLLVTWWSSPFDRLRDNPFGLFDERDIVPIAYALFALALGTFFGVVIRRTLPAMVATLVAYTSVRLAFTEWIRERFASPLHASIPFQAPGTQSFPGQAPATMPGDWIVSSDTINSSGKIVGHFGGIGPNGEINFRGTGNGSTYFVGVGKCPNTIPAPPAGRGNDSSPPLSVQHAIQKCVNSFHLRSIVSYQPTSRYWSFQWYELTIFIVLALLLASVSWWWVRRRLS